MLNFDYLEKLNEKQKEAVTHLNGPLLIVAELGLENKGINLSYMPHNIIWQSISTGGFSHFHK